MRDGIPGKLPVPRKYREAVICADRPADKGTDRVTERFALALHDDLQKIFAPVKAELKKLASSDSPTFPGFEISIGQHPEGSHRVDELLDDMRRATKEGSPADKAICDALASQAQDVLTSRLRSILENLAPELSASDYKEIRSEIERGITSIDVGLEVRSFLNGGRVTTPVQDDEDLRGQNGPK